MADSEVEDVDLGLRDLQTVVLLGLARGAHLLTAGEMAIARRIGELTGPAGRAYARLTDRKPEVFVVDRLAFRGVEDVGAALQALASLDLVGFLVPWDRRRDGLTVPELKDGCRRLGLPVGGKRAALMERLAGQTGWCDRAFVRVRHRGLLFRLARFAFLHRRADRSAFVVERLGHMTWPEYQRTRGAIHSDRRALQWWEALYATRDALPPDVLLAALDAPVSWPAGGLDLRPGLVRRVMAHARAAEREDPAGARALYEGLVEGGHLAPASVAVRIARTLESEGAADRALSHLKSVRSEARGANRIAIGRSGRRVSRSLRRSWAPDPPRQAPPERHLVLAAGARLGTRPGYQTDAGDVPVEEAVRSALKSAQREALHAEGPLWTTLFALLFAETYFLPIPNMLPARFMSGPLDLGTQAFRAPRAEAVDAVLGAIAAGEAPDRIVEADARWRGVGLGGANWALADAPQLAAVARGMGPDGLTIVLRTLLDEGWRASRGLPDLVLLPGPGKPLSVAMPSKLPEEAVLIEVKGPGDSVRDEQAVWFDRLLRSGVRTELWLVRGDS